MNSHHVEPFRKAVLGHLKTVLALQTHPETRRITKEPRRQALRTRTANHRRRTTNPNQPEPNPTTEATPEPLSYTTLPDVTLQVQYAIWAGRI